MLKKQGTEKVIHKSAEATGDLIGSKIADKITSLKVKDEEPQEQEIIIPPEKRQQIISDLRLF